MWAQNPLAAYRSSKLFSSSVSYVSLNLPRPFIDPFAMRQNHSLLSKSNSLLLFFGETDSMAMLIYPPHALPWHLPFIITTVFTR